MTISRADAERAVRFRDDERPEPSASRETPRARNEPRAPNQPGARDQPQPRTHEPRTHERTLARHVEQQPASSDYLAFLSNVSSTSSRSNAVGAAAAAVVGPVTDADRDAAMQAKLDAVRDAFSGPYVVAGQQIRAQPMFRMTTHAVSREMAAAVDSLGARAGVRAPIASRFGQPTPQDLVKITQALIDAGRLPPGTGDLATRIRRMQWDHGIGVDCAGYAKQALIACSARAPKTYPAGSESFRDLDTTRASSFARVPIEKIRPGDLVTLDSTEVGGWGHNVVVYSHVNADAACRAKLGERSEAVRDFLASPGPHHVLEVDSSWGAGTEGAECGGYRRDTWLYDASTKTWGSFEPGISPPSFVSSELGPADDKLHGAYRPR
jgi:hypothetical protein